MSLPQVLLVDDSAAIVAFEAAALSGLYALSTASDGAEALRRIRDLKPQLVLLDLSMPIMDGDRVVEAVRADHELDDVAIVIVSTEADRAKACLALGAHAYLPKPLKADELRATVARVLEEVQKKKASAALPVLVVRLGVLEVAVRLDRVVGVALMPRMRPLAAGPEFMREVVDVHGAPVPVFDLAGRLGAPLRRSLADRSLLLLRVDAGTIAIPIDRAHEPELVPHAEVVFRNAFPGGSHEPLRSTLEAVLKRPGAPVPVLDPAALLSPVAIELLADAPRLAQSLVAGGDAAGGP